MDYKQRFYPESRFGGFTDQDGTLRFYARARSLAGPDAVVLDVGCGRGERYESLTGFRRETCLFRGKCARVVGLDVDPVGAANPGLDEFRLIRGDRWPMDDQSVDLCLSDFVIEHLPDPSLFFRECRRVLRPGGHVAIRTPNALGYIALAARFIPESLHARVLSRAQPARQHQDVFPTLYRCNTRRALRNQLQQNGFECHAYTVEPDASYLNFSIVAYAMGVLYQHLAPPLFRNTILAFGRKIV